MTYHLIEKYNLFYFNILSSYGVQNVERKQWSYLNNLIAMLANVLHNTTKSICSYVIYLCVQEIALKTKTHYMYL